MKFRREGNDNLARKLLGQHIELESPTNFWLWGGLSCNFSSSERQCMAR